jgi:hypothetical protein
VSFEYDQNGARTARAEHVRRLAKLDEEIETLEKQQAAESDAQKAMQIAETLGEKRRDAANTRDQIRRIETELANAGRSSPI